MVKVVFHKYPHRRLYNATAGHFAKLSDVATLVKAGADVSVHDHRTGVDVTRSILSRILLREEAKAQDGPLTVNVQRQLIRLLGSDSQGVLPRYLDKLAALLQTIAPTSTRADGRQKA